MFAGELREKMKKERKAKRNEMTVTLEKFFEMGGMAYYYNKGSEWKECKSFDDFQNIKADYLQFYLNGKRYVFEDQLKVGEVNKN